jgi:hypothetical protein
MLRIRGALDGLREIGLDVELEVVAAEREGLDLRDLDVAQRDQVEVGQLAAARLPRR